MGGREEGWEGGREGGGEVINQGTPVSQKGGKIKQSQHGGQTETGRR